MPNVETPPGECPQCWHHAHVIHKGNALGLLPEPECGPCLDHMVNGCPNVTPKKSMWR
ncbi:pRL2-8 [Streptomyces sp. E11-3]|uniref:pRL2-8 n=1 Tax=Streptomyces sp. E11-3 TaxID=3110112 RepID=UPI00398124E2